MSVDDIYYNESGEEIYRDKKNEPDRYYVINTTRTTEDLYAGVSEDIGFSNPISPTEAAMTEEKIRAGDLTGDHMKNVAFIGTEGQMDAMFNSINDNGTRGDIARNNREYGGKITLAGNVVASKPSPVLNPVDGDKVSISISAAPGERTYHSHPSGTKREGNLIYNWGGAVQAPSGTDIANSTSKSELVFGMYSYTLFLYNKRGVYATMPFNGLIK